MVMKYHKTIVSRTNVNWACYPRLYDGAHIHCGSEAVVRQYEIPLIALLLGIGLI